MGFKQNAVKKSRKEKRAGLRKKESPLVLDGSKEGRAATGNESGAIKLLAQLTSAVVTSDSITKIYGVC
jgi:hypothetical protein